MGLRQAALERMSCAGCGSHTDHDEHSPLFLHSVCHPGFPTWTRYENGEIVIVCAWAEVVDDVCSDEVHRCGKEIARIEVAP